MHRRPAPWLTALLLLAAALTIPACKKSDSAGTPGSGGPSAGGVNNATTTGDIVIGQFASLKGDVATFGVSSDEGLQLALDEINAKGGVLGRKVRVITEDDRSQAEEARTAAEKLINRDKVVALIGEIASSNSIAAAPAAEHAKIPMLSPGSTNPKVTQQGKYIFRACFIDPFQGEAMARFALENLKLKKFAILYAVNSDYSTGLRQYVHQALDKRGGAVVIEQSYNEGKDKDFNAQLTNIRNANPDAIFVTGYYKEAALIAKQARGLGMKMPLIGGDGWDSDQLIKVGGDALADCYFSNHYSPDEDRPEVKAFVDAYKAKFNGKVPDAMAILGYDAMRLMADAITRANSTEGPKIRDALAATKDFPGAAGAITIDADRNATKPLVIVKIADNQFKFVAAVKPD